MQTYRAQFMSLEPLPTNLREELNLTSNPHNAGEAVTAYLRDLGIFYFRDQYNPGKPAIIDLNPSDPVVGWRDVTVYQHFVELETDNRSFARPATYHVAPNEKYLGPPDKKAWLIWNRPVIMRVMTWEGPILGDVGEHLQRTEAFLKESEKINLASQSVEQIKFAKK